MKKILKTILVAGAALFGAVQAWGVDVLNWTVLQTNLQGGNSVRLMADVTHTGKDGSMIDVAKGTAVTLDLNGHTITCFSSATSKRPFQISNAGSVLTITGSGTINGQNGEHTDVGGGFAWVREGGKLVLSGGTVTNFKSKDGAAIRISSNGGGTVEMNDGTISNCTATGTEGGGAVYVDQKGTFTMNGGTISGCTASGKSANGGAVFVKGSFTWYGGVIKGCYAPGFGIAVYCSTTTSGATAKLYGGVVLPDYSNNFSQYVKTADGYGNTSLNSMSVIGKNVSANGDKLRGGTYYFNPTDPIYSNVGLGLDTCCTVTGSAGAYTVNAPYTVTVQAVNGANVSVSGSGQTGSAAGSYLVPKGGSITATYSAKSGYVMVGSVKSSSLSNVQANQTLSTSSISTIAVSSSTPSSCSNWAQVKAVLEAGYSVKLATNIADCGNQHCFPAANTDVTLDLNGYTMTQCEANYLFELSTAGTGKLIVTDTSSGKNGAIIGKGTTTGGDGGNFARVYSSGRGLVLNAGTIRNFKLANSSSNGGGAIKLWSGTTFTMNGGTISDCTCASSGGAIYNDGTFTMNGGTISGCTASWGGGAIYINGGTFTMNGGTLSGNTADCGGALYNDNAGTAYVYGGTIRDNESKGNSWSDGGFCFDGQNANCHTYIYGGYFSGNKAPSDLSQLFIAYGYKKSGCLYGGVFAVDPTLDAESKGCLVLQDSATVTKVGDKYVVGKGVTTADGTLTGGTYTFNPTNAEYAAAGVAVSPYAVLTEDATAKTWTLTPTPSTQVGDDAWAMIKDGVCTIYGTGTTWDFSNTDNPLDASWDSVKDVVVADGVTGLGAYMFYKFYNLTNMTVAASVTNLGKGSVYLCHSLESVSFLGTSVPTMAENVLNLKAGITMNGDTPVVTLVPKVTVGGKSPVLMGTNDLTDKDSWVKVAKENVKQYHFFKYVVGE